MTDTGKISRRDWFRLQLPKSHSQAEKTQRVQKKQNSSEEAMGQTKPGLKPIAHPVNHDGLDLSELPPMREAILSEEEILQLFADIEAFGSDVLLMQRSTPSARATASRATSSESLQVAQEALISKSLSRLQIRYHWQNTAWIDTLESRPEGFRLVRISHQ